jgi:hypothetical protein
MTEQIFMKVVDNRDLLREKDSRAILNNNPNELAKYKEERLKRLQLKQLLSENEKMKTDISEIKSLLIQLLGQK